MAATNLREKSFDIIYKVTLNGTEIEIARAKTGILSFDYGNQVVVSISLELRKKLELQ